MIHLMCNMPPSLAPPLLSKYCRHCTTPTTVVLHCTIPASFIQHCTMSTSVQKTGLLNTEQVPLLLSNSLNNRHSCNKCLYSCIPALQLWSNPSTTIQHCTLYTTNIPAIFLRLPYHNLTLIYKKIKQKLMKE